MCRLWMYHVKKLSWAPQMVGLSAWASRASEAETMSCGPRLSPTNRVVQLLPHSNQLLHTAHLQTSRNKTLLKDWSNGLYRIRLQQLYGVLLSNILCYNNQIIITIIIIVTTKSLETFFLMAT